MSIELKSGTSSDKLTVGVTSKAAYAELYDAAGNTLTPTDGSLLFGTQGAMMLAGQHEGQGVHLRAGRAGSIGVTNGQTLFWEECEGATLNTARWTAALTTFTNAQTAAGINMNSAASVAANGSSLLTSSRHIPRRLNVPLDFTARIRASAVANSTIEIGMGYITAGTAQIVNGVFWQHNSGSSAARPVIVYNSADIAVGNDVDLSAHGTNYLQYGIVLEDHSATFTIRNTQTGEAISRQTLRIPLTAAKWATATHMPVAIRVYNGAVAPVTAPVCVVASVSVLQLDESAVQTASHAASGLNLGAEVGPATATQAATWANGAAPANSALSATVASATTLGGLFSFAAVAGAATDYVLFGYTVPLPYSFFCTRIHISTWNAGAAVATTPTLLVWGVGANSTAVSLATASYNKVGVGVQSLPVGAAIGTAASEIDAQFEAPLFTGAGRFFAVILRMPVSTATASQLVQGFVTVRGYFQ